MPLIHSDTDLDWDSLRRVQQIASALAGDLKSIPALANCKPPSNAHDLTRTLPTLELPFPHDILKPVSTLSIPASIRQKLDERSSEIFAELQGQYRAAFERVCIAVQQGGPIFEGSIQSLQKVYESLYQKQHSRLAQHWVSTVFKEVAARQQPSPSKITFKNEFKPALETYFSLNGYPPVAHRTILAQKCEMTARQIEVWFQNHRNRAKKEGKNIQRLDSDFPLRQALANLPSLQHRLPTPPLDSNNNAKLAPTASTSFHKPAHRTTPTFLDDSYDRRPPHSFPETTASDYPEPFPNDDGVFKFPPPVWRRKPATKPIPPHSVDMDEFSQSFHLKLNFAESSRRQGTSPSNLSKPDGHSPEPWFTSTTSFALSAPLPYLLREPDVSLQISPPPIPFLHIPNPEPTFGSSSLGLPIATLVSPSDRSVKRKTRPLPRRTPHFGSRTSSFASNTSARSRNSSWSSNHSSPEPLTPPPLPNVDLPILYGDDLGRSSFNLCHTGPEASYLSTLVHSRDSYTASSKSPDLYSFDIPFQDFSHDLGAILC